MGYLEDYLSGSSRCLSEDDENVEEGLEKKVGATGGGARKFIRNAAGNCRNFRKFYLFL